MADVPTDMSLDNDFDNRDDNVHVISPEDSIVDDADRQDDETPPLRADDIEAIKATYMPQIPDLETLDEAQFTWDINEWRTLARREHSPTFECAGFPWRVLFFPYGNNVDYASFYLEHGYEDKPPEDWYACAQFLLVLWNPNNPQIFQQHAASHRFTPDEGDWGFTRFAELRKLFSQPWENFDRPMVENNAAKVTAFVRVVKDPTGVLWHSFINYDSKKETGMVGLKNQGATCYLNSLLQSLYFTTAFRKAVYQIPTDIEESAREVSAYALQRLFLQLQTSENAVATNELTASFGWSSREIFEQQDVQELSRILMERLEEKMKGTEAENALAKMFVGKMKTYISCINVDYQSSRVEDYWDLQLNVSKMQGVDESFKDYINPETMDGDNKYHAEGFGLQDAKKGVIFESFPSVLHLQLKRFEYDFQRDVMMKINDRFEFPDTWDAAPFLSETADRSEPYVYKLHGVLVHSGDLHAGHYYAFIKPTKDGHFYRFDDDRVTRATLKEAIDDNFGGEYPLANGVTRNANAKVAKRSNNAYMLVYIRECHLDQVLLTEETVEPPEQVAIRFAEERAAFEKRRKDKEEAHLYMEVVVATEDNFKHHQGFDLMPTLTSELTEEAARPKVLRIKKTLTINELVKDFAEQNGLDANGLRPWCMVNRQNGTTRPDQPILEGNMTVEDASAKFGHKNNGLRLWVEPSSGTDKDGKPVWGDTQIDYAARGGKEGDKPIVLFLKYFDVDNQTLYGVGHFYALLNEKVSDLSPYILQRLGWQPGTSYKIFEEIKHNMIEPMKSKLTLHQAELQDGDIITVQRAIQESEVPQVSRKFTEVREFYDYLLNRLNVKFAPKVTGENPEHGEFSLPLNKKLTYDELSERVGEYLGVEPTHLRFSPVHAQTGRAKNPIRYTTNFTLGQILNTTYSSYGPPNSRSDALYYEVLECSMAELEQRKGVKITWLPEGQNKEEHFEILVRKTGTVEDIIANLAQKAAISEDVIQRIRVFEMHSNRMHKELALSYPVLSLSDYTTLCADIKSDEELTLGEDDRIVYGFNFDREVGKPHGYPFAFVVKEGELLSAAKERISKQIGVKGKQFEKIKFAAVPKTSYPKAEYLSDEDILSDKIGRDEYLGLDHPSKTRSYLGRSDQIFIR